MNDDAKLAELLGDEAMWAEPSPELEARVVGAIEDDAGVADLDAARRRRGARVSTVAPWLVAGAAAAAAVALAVLPFGGPSRDFTATLAGTALSPGARGEAELENTQSGVEIRLDVSGLPRARRGFFYQAWVKGPRGLVTIGTFHTGGKITLWSGVDVAQYSTLTVTLEPEDGDATSSGRKVLAGPIKR
jgi:hypothetical protein